MTGYREQPISTSKFVAALDEPLQKAIRRTLEENWTMKHTLLARLDSKISSIISELEQVQALTLAGLSISRLWAPFEKWALENKAPKLIEWGAVCFNTLWDQINLDFALCCFYDPKLLPGLQRPSFWSDITAIVGQGTEYIYDTIFSDAGSINESDLIILVEADPRWRAECQRIKDDVAFLKTHFKDKTAVLELKEKYIQIDIFV